MRRPRKRCVYLPATGKRVSPGACVSAIRAAKASPDAGFKTGLTTCWPVTDSEIIQQFRAGMHDRITRAVPRSKRGSPGDV